MSEQATGHTATGHTGAPVEELEAGETQDGKGAASAVAEPAPQASAEGRDQLLGHDYDGIQEYDNPLPGWWMTILWLCILWSPFYAVWIHGGAERTVLDEYRADAGEVAKQRAEEALKNPVTDESLLTLTKDQTSVQVGANVFAAKCVTCHGPQGQGKIGPNLTDDHWILGAAPTRIYTTISEGGRDGKGMRAWSKELGPTEIRKVTAYVLTLRGTNPPEPKAPEGELVQ